LRKSERTNSCRDIGFHVSVEKSRGCKFEITICDLKKITPPESKKKKIGFKREKEN
jgi:hypothetical protein